MRKKPPDTTPAGSRGVATTARRGSHARELRIIGGQWRGRKLRFPAGTELRPTPDRVRETVFNWLTPHIIGANCLDLFAGSGALGLEALSRGAASAEFIDSDPRVTFALQERLLEWRATGGRVRTGDAIAYLRAGRVADASRFDVVFVDPPFASDLLGPALHALSADDWLTDAALLYIEAPAKAGAPQLPAGWTLLRSKTAGEVGYHLARLGSGT